MTPISYDLVAEQLANQRVMLVGGAGFIGHNLALELRRLAVEVMVVDNLMVNSVVDNVYQAGPSLDAMTRKIDLLVLLDRFTMMRDAGVSLRNADARVMTDLGRAFDEFRPTKVVHLAAIASAVEAERNPGLMFDLQLVALRNILELCRLSHAGVNQIVLMSSSTVYGDFETPSVDETTRPQPRGIYANTKYMAERLVRTYRHQHGLGTTIIRPSALYGERCVSRRVSQAFIENALAGRPLLLEGGGDGRLDFTYIADLVEGLVRALGLHRDPSDSNTFNITFGNARTIADLAGIVKELVPEAILEERPRTVIKPIRGTLSTARAEAVLGFNSRWPLEVGYRRYCEWYIAQWRRASSMSEAEIALSA